MDSFNSAKCFFGLFQAVFFQSADINRWGKGVVFVIGNRCLLAHNHMPYTEKKSPPVPTCGPENGLQLGMVYITQTSALSALTRGIHLRI